MGLSVTQMFDYLKSTATNCALNKANPICAGDLDAVGTSVLSDVMPDGDAWQQCIGTAYVQISHQECPAPADFAATMPACRSAGRGWLTNSVCQQQLNATCSKLPLSVGAIYSDWASRDDLKAALSASSYIPALSGETLLISGCKGWHCNQTANVYSFFSL